VVIAEDNDCRDKTEAKPLNGWLKMHAVIDNLIEIDKLYGMRKAFLFALASSATHRVASTLATQQQRIVAFAKRSPTFATWACGLQSAACRWAAMPTPNFSLKFPSARGRGHSQRSGAC
jgi:hypothetical protein